MSTFTKSLTISNKLGLHARAATKLAQLSQKFNAEVTICLEGKKADASSVMGLMLLAGGFGKTVEHNLRLLNNLGQLHSMGLPLLVGTSRKTMIAHVLGRPVDQRLAGGLATVVLGVQQGAQIFRVHDVRETVDVVRMTEAVLKESVQDEDKK